MAVALKLTTVFQFSKEKLKLVYEVHNPATRDVYLLNRLYLTLPEWKMTPDVIYVHFLPETRTIWLNKKLAEIPQGPLITSPVAPYVTPVRAGARFKEEIVLPLPLVEYRQYSGEIRAAADQSPFEMYQEVYFSLGYYWRPDGTKEEELEIQGTPVIMPRPPMGTPVEFGVVESARSRLDVPVQLRGGDPEKKPAGQGGAVKANG